VRQFQVKVCGITRAKDALVASELGADMIGMIFFRNSPRYITLKEAKLLVRHLPPTVDRVGVFVDENVEKVLRVARQLLLDYVQLHGHETAREVMLIKQSGYKVIKAFHLSSKADYGKLYSSKADLVLIDNATSELPGGTGERFDWGLVAPKKIGNLMLSGGIAIDNVEEGVKLFDPLVVDVNSGVETRPGIKSEAKLRRFFDKCNRMRYGRKK
jgi:phosphoribosylanthranilate isomerase